MPNHVTHKVIFAAGELPRVLAAIGDGSNFDFAKLIPVPLHVYRGNLGSEDEEDFKANWYEWNNANWGTKWNAYDFSSGVEGDRAFIRFDTAWSVPYPVIAALANSLLISMEHRYFDEGHNFWGTEKWDAVSGAATRRTKKFKQPEDRGPLFIELKGYDPDNESDE